MTFTYKSHPACPFIKTHQFSPIRKLVHKIVLHKKAYFSTLSINFMSHFFSPKFIEKWKF